ncbi:hypothetical protein ACVMIH_007739 [Bradyrhizobium sp. USDA 4503]
MVFGLSGLDRLCRLARVDVLISAARFGALDLRSSWPDLIQDEAYECITDVRLAALASLLRCHGLSQERRPWHRLLIPFND